jgi:hypothetical protein
MKLKFIFGIIGYGLLGLSASFPIIAPASAEPTPRTCASRKSPTKGAPSIEQVKMYLMCDSEGSFSQGTNITLIRDIKVQIGRSRRASQPDFSFMDGVTVDERKPVYDIRGSFVMYGCRSGASNSCMVYTMPSQKGICFVDNFGDWRCRMLGAPSNTLRNAPWPTN